MLALQIACLLPGDTPEIRQDAHLEVQNWREVQKKNTKHQKKHMISWTSQLSEQSEPKSPVNVKLLPFMK